MMEVQNINNNPNYYNQSLQQGNGAYYPRRPYDPTNEPMTLKDWILTFLLLLIPIVNIVLPFVWAFSANVNKSKKTFFQAYLIFMLIGIVILLISIVFLIGYITAVYHNYLNNLDFNY